MQDGARVSAVMEIITLINNAWAEGSHAPADAMLAKYFRERRYIGSKDRGAISKLAYYILRNGATIDWWLEQAKADSTPRNIVILAIVYAEKASLAEIEALFSGAEHCPAPLTDTEKELIRTYEGTPLIHGTMPDSVRFNFPDWMSDKITDLFGDKIYVAMEAMNQEAPVDLRTNTLKASREGLIAALSKEGFEPVATNMSDYGVRLKKRGAMFATQAFREGWFEMQDEGSQMIAQLMEAKPGQKVIDFCAGAGGKTLALAASMQNKGRILAWDISDARLSQMPKRLARAGVHNVQLRVLKDEHDAFVKRHKETADAVLLDVPCTGSGTWRRNPDLKWRTEEKDLNELVDVQQRILNSAARLVKPKGRMVYATCSLFKEENENQVAAFLESHKDFRLRPVGEDQHMRLSTHQHGTDGFFAAVLERVS